MPIEIERRFLVRSDEWRAASASSSLLRQSYLSRSSESRVRIRWAEDHGTITVKGPRAGLARDEFEYPIPALEADYLLSAMCVTPIIEKVRHWVPHAGMTWEVDVYRGQAAGLVTAEVELDRSDQPFVRPKWIGAEVTHDPRYRSAGIEQGLWRCAAVRPPRKARAPEGRQPEPRGSAARRPPRPDGVSAATP